MLLLALFFFIIGLCFGSFTNVLVDRTQRGESIKGFSKCDFCGYKLQWFDNIPLLSYVLLKGKCRKCGKKLSLQYPLIEFLCGVVFSASFLLCFYGASGGVLMPGFLFVLTTAYLLFVVLVWDVKYMIIPDFIVVIGLAIALIFRVLQSYGQSCFLGWDCSLPEGLLGSLVIGGFFGAMYYFSRGRWIGGGDVKAGFWLGMVVGIKMAYFFILFAYLLGSVVAVALLLASAKKMKSQIPFGPFLVFSAYLIIFGKEVIMKIWNNLI
ncbi:MAG: prepilin peptidase [Candidatus Moranbacteria bacterium]|nr:prepilin peptidase [Candidatus Moranbacteria bacterium]